MGKEEVLFSTGFIAIAKLFPPDLIQKLFFPDLCLRKETKFPDFDQN